MKTVYKIAAVAAAGVAGYIGYKNKEKLSTLAGVIKSKTIKKEG